MLPGHITDSAEVVLHEAISADRIGIRGAPGGSGPVPAVARAAGRAAGRHSGGRAGQD